MSTVVARSNGGRSELRACSSAALPDVAGGDFFHLATWDGLAEVDVGQDRVAVVVAVGRGIEQASFFSLVDFDFDVHLAIGLLGQLLAEPGVLFALFAQEELILRHVVLQLIDLILMHSQIANVGVAL